MFLEFYGLREQPFGSTADPRFLYGSTPHLEALGSLRHEIQNALGFSALIAEPGLGKTTLMVQLLETFRASLTAFVFETQCNSLGLMRHLLRELRVSTQERDPVALHECLQDALESAAHEGRRVLMIIDEAQNLQSSVLESVRLLSNFESRRGKLLHIILSGQPLLAERLSHPDLIQLRQRVWMLNWLKRLPLEEVAPYVNHRLRVAGYCGDVLFSDSALHSIAVRSKGTPREINRICFKALSFGSQMREPLISREIAEEAACDSGASVTVGMRRASQDSAGCNVRCETAPVLEGWPLAVESGRVGESTE